MKARLLGGTVPDVGKVTRHARAIRVAVPGEHHGQAINHVVKLRRMPRGQSSGQHGLKGLKGRFQAVETQHECLIRRQAWEPLSPILENQAVHPLLLEAALGVSKEPDGVPYSFD